MNTCKVTTAALALASTPVWALDPASVDLAGFRFVPTLEVSESYDDNYRGLHRDEKSSWITGINPEFVLIAETRNSGYRLRYEPDHKIYHSDSDATNTDHHLVLDSVMEFTSRQRLKWQLAYHRMEETVNTESREENDKYSSKIARLVYGFGAQSARNQLELGANYEQRRYHNSGDLNASEERDSTELRSTWFHRLGGRTRALAELRYADHSYVQRNSIKDNQETALLLGATWDATAKTEGTVRVGLQNKEFDSDVYDDYTRPTWEVGVAYKPRTYSIFRLDTRQAFDEGDDGASAIHNWTTRLGWEHAWTSRIRSEFDVRYSEFDYKGIAREDEFLSYGLGLTYSPMRWIDVTLAYRWSDNDSSEFDENYRRNVYMLSLALSL